MYVNLTWNKTLCIVVFMQKNSVLTMSNESKLDWHWASNTKDISKCQTCHKT